MKGISAIIATILLLLIVVAIVGFTFGFFQNIFSTSSQATTTQVQQTTQQLQQVVRVQNVNANSVTVSNAGSGTVTTNTLAVYINNNAVLCNAGNTWSVASMAPGATATCTFAVAGSCVSGQSIRVATSATFDTSTCP